MNAPGTVTMTNDPSKIMPIPQPANETAAMIAVLERALRDPSIDIARARELFTMMREAKATRAEDAFNDAMRTAQSEMGPVRKDAANPQTRSRYASHLALDTALRPVYTKHGFALSFNTAPAPETMVRIECLVTCAGHQRTYGIDLPADGKGARGNDVMTKTHATMSAITYGRRGLLLMIFNIATGEMDDDGNAAGKVELVITAKQADELYQLVMDAAAEGSKTAVKDFNDWAGVSSIADLPASKYDEATRLLKLKLARKEKAI